MDEEPGGIQSMGSQRIRHNWATNTFWLHCAACGILVPWPGIEPVAHWTTREVPTAHIYYLLEARSLARIKIQMLAGLCSFPEDGGRNSFPWLPVFRDHPHSLPQGPSPCLQSQQCCISFRSIWVQHAGFPHHPSLPVVTCAHYWTEVKDLTKARLVNVSKPGSWRGWCPIDNSCQLLGHKYSHRGQFQATNRISADLKASWRCSYGSSSSTAFNPVTFHLAQHYQAYCWLLKSDLFCFHRVCTGSPWTSSSWTECVKCSVRASGDFGNIRSLRLLTESTLSSLSGM